MMELFSGLHAAKKSYLENNLVTQLDFARFFWYAVVVYSGKMQVKKEKGWGENRKIWKGKSFSYKASVCQKERCLWTVSIRKSILVFQAS